MPCKHENGTDPCVISAKHCLIAGRLYMRRKRENPEFRRKSNEYNASMFVSQRSKATRADVGQAGEHLVAADLLHRGMKVTKPLNTNGDDDLHALTKSGWVTIQVKAGQRHRKTGRLRAANSHGDSITSDVLAVVFLPTKQIRYIPKNIRSLPPELETFLDDFLKGLDK